MERRTPEQAERVGERLGRLAMRLSKKHRLKAMENLAYVFPELSETERAALAKRSFESFGRLAADFMRTRVRSNEELLGAFETLEGEDIFRQAHDLGRGVIVLSGHFGNFERAAHLIAAMGFPLTAVMRDTNDPELSEMVKTMHADAGVELLFRGFAVRPILERLRAGRCVTMLPDLNTREAYAELFGRPAGIPLGPAVLHQRTGAPIIIGFCARTGPNKYRVMGRRLLMPEDTAGMAPTEIMRIYNQELEAVIREFPDQYLWMHDRWRSARNAGMF